MSSYNQRPRFAGITAAADALAEGTTTSVALCEAMAARHAEIDETVKGYLQFDLDGALVAARAADHRWTSFHEWVKRGVYPEDWGAFEPTGIQDWDLE